MVLSDLFDNRLLVKVLFWNFYLDFIAFEQESLEEGKAKFLVKIGLLYTACSLRKQFWPLLRFLTNQSAFGSDQLDALHLDLVSESIIVCAKTTELFKALNTLIKPF